MWNKVLQPRTTALLIAIFLLALAAPPAFAGQAAEVGTIHPDGSVEIFLDRLQPTLRDSLQSTMNVVQTTLSISNGFLYVDRHGDDGCTVERFAALTRSASGSLDGVASSLRTGDYVPITAFPLASPRVEASRLLISVASLFTCENVDCDGPCKKVLGSEGLVCHCKPFDLSGDDEYPPWLDVQEDDYPLVDGCERRLNLSRPGWNLNQSVDSAHIETY